MAKDPVKGRPASRSAQVHEDATATNRQEGYELCRNDALRQPAEENVANCQAAKDFEFALPMLTRLERERGLKVAQAPIHRKCRVNLETRIAQRGGYGKERLATDSRNR